MHDWQALSDKMKRSLKRGYTYWCASVLNRVCTSIEIEYSCFNEVNVLKSKTTMPPPSTVSIALHKTFGVTDSKSWMIHMPKVYPRILCVSL